MERERVREGEMDASDHFAKLNKPDPKRKISYGLMWQLIHREMIKVIQVSDH